MVKGKACPSLLNSYGLERRPVGLQNCDWGLFTFSNFPVLQAVVGLLPGEKEFNQQRFARIFEDSPYGKTARHHLARIFATQDIEFGAHNIELGFSYDTGAVVPDGTKKPEEDYGEEGLKDVSPQRFTQGGALSPGSPFWLCWLARWGGAPGSLKKDPWRRWRRRQRKIAK